MRAPILPGTRALRPLRKSCVLGDACIGVRLAIAAAHRSVLPGARSVGIYFFFVNTIFRDIGLNVLALPISPGSDAFISGLAGIGIRLAIAAAYRSVLRSTDRIRTNQRFVDAGIRNDRTVFGRTTGEGKTDE